jgi:hypothetical protein
MSSAVRKTVIDAAFWYFAMRLSTMAPAIAPASPPELAACRDSADSVTVSPRGGATADDSEAAEASRRSDAARIPARAEVVAFGTADMRMQNRERMPGPSLERKFGRYPSFGESPTIAPRIRPLDTGHDRK